MSCSLGKHLLRVLTNVTIPFVHRSYARTMVQLAHRPYLPASDGPGFPIHLQPPREDFPKLVNWTQSNLPDHQTEANLTELGANIRPMIDKMITYFPALLMKNLPVYSCEQLSVFLEGLGYDYMPYLGGLGMREVICRNVSNASAEPPQVNIEPHNEMAYLPEWPKMIMFFCEVPPAPDTGGETVINDVRATMKRLPTYIVDKFVRLGIRYVRNMPDIHSGKAWYSSWQESLMTDDKTQAERTLRSQGMDFTWHLDGTLTASSVLPAVRKHHTTGEMLWFNQIHLHHVSYLKSTPEWVHSTDPDKVLPFDTTYGDGSSIEDEVLQEIRNAMWETTVGWQMSRGDLLLLDNMIAQHGRMSFTGERRLRVSMVAMDKDN